MPKELNQAVTERNKIKAQERESQRLAGQPVTPAFTITPPVPTPESVAPENPAFNPVNGAPVVQTMQPTPPPAQVSNGEDTTAFNQQVQATATPAQPTQTVTQPTPVTNTATTNVTPTKETITNDQITLEREKIKLQNEAQTLKNQEEAKVRQADRDMQNGLIAQDENAIYGMIATGAMIPASVKTSPYYKKAQDTFNKVQQYSTLTPIQLLSAVDNGQLVPGTAVYNQLLKDPSTKAKMTEVAKYTSTTPLNYDKVTESASSTILSNNPTTAQALADGFISADEYEKITNTPAVLAKLNEVQEKNSAYNNAKYEIEQAVDKAKQDFAGSPFLQGIIDDIRTAGQSRLSLLRSEADNALGVYTELKSDSASLFETNLSQYNKELSTKTAREQAIFSQQLQNGDINSTDPFIKQRGVENAVEQIVGNIATQRPKAQIIADVMASGDIMGTLAQLQRDIQAKPEYKAMQAYNLSKLTPEDKTIEGKAPVKVGDVTYEWDTKTNTYKAVNGNGGTATTIGTISGAPLIDVPRNVNGTTNNVGQDTNNPGNIMGDTEGQRKIALGYGAIGFYKSPNGRTYAVFPDMESGKQASYKDLEAKLSGKSSWVNPNTTLGQFASGWVSGPSAPINKNAVNTYVMLSGYSADTPISQIPVETLASVIFKNEGVDTSRSASVTAPTMPTGNFSATDSRVFNSLTPSEKAKKQNDPKFISFVEAQNEIYNNPDAKIDDILKYSAGGDDLGETSIQQLSKFNQALSQVKNLKDSLSEQSTGPIIGTLRSYNPYDANAQALKAELNSLVPNIARGVYGEVGVLTDADIENYKKTLPNIKSTEDTNKLVLAMTLNTMLNGYKGQLQTLAGAGKDVSKLQGKYKEYETTINSLLSSIGKGSPSTTTTTQGALTKPGVYTASNGKNYFQPK